jgi:hypothetical protein
MAIRKQEAEPTGEDLAAVVAALAAVVNRIAVQHIANGIGTASWRQIMTQELKAATAAECDVIERFLTEHPPGG